MIYIPSENIQTLAKGVGFQACGITELQSLDRDLLRWKEWIARGWHATMHYMEKYEEQRRDSTSLLEGGKTLISLLLHYNPKEEEIYATHKIAKFAWGTDYHLVMKQALLKLIEELQQLDSGIVARAFVDTAPLFEKSWAQRAGLGWIGKNSLLIHPIYGSYCYIGEIICNISTTYSEPYLENGCGACKICIETCPNRALDESKGLNANRCISYHTIENKEDDLPSGINLMQQVFGCDLCQDSCPHNRRSPKSSIRTNAAIIQLQRGEPTREDFNKLRKNTSLSRIRYEQWVRNIRHNENDTKTRDESYHREKPEE